MTQTTEVDAETEFAGTEPADRRMKLRGYLGLAAMAYIPPLLTQPGKVAADTKQYLYLDPSRLLGRAASMWDPNIGFGTVTHQNIGYLFPMGPYYWLLQAIRVPDWVAQRLWLGSIVFFAGLGVLYLMRTLGVKGPGVAIAAVAYMFSPYSLDYAARISVLLMPWAGLGWMIALTIKALRDDGRWRYPACFALVVQLVGGVNATALIFAGVGPVLWILYSVVTRQVTLRRAIAVTAKIGGLTLLTSLWWMVGLWSQGSYGLDILKYTETVKAVSRTSTPNEVLRGLGYWFFYGQDSVGPWTEASVNYTQHIEVIMAGYGLAALALTGAAFTRWRHRSFFLLTTVVGAVIAVGAFPYTSPTPLGSLFKAFANSSAAGLALRSTGRAIPLVTLGMAVMLGIGVNAAAQRFSTVKNPRRGLVIAGAIFALIIIDFPALYDGTYYGRNLERPENIPSYWKQATSYLDQGSHQTRVLELPGSDFASYVWGNTVDPITPGLMDRPYVARELIPWGSPASQDLLNAMDERIQEGTFEPGGFTDLARRMAIGSVDMRYDIEFKRYNIVPPLDLQRDFDSVPGLTLVKTFGPPLHGKKSTGYYDEAALAQPQQAQPPEVAVYNVNDPMSIVRTESTQRPLVMAGDGNGLVDASNVGLLDGTGVVLYSASYAKDPAALRKAIGSDGVLVVTDSNRKRARRWSTVLDNEGYTEQAGEKPLVFDPSDARLDTFPDAGDDAYTVTDQQGVKSIQASAYGNPITYTPEDRASRAFDGNTDTAWNVAAFDLAIGNKIQLETKKPITTDRIKLVQTQSGPLTRWITQVRLTFDGGHPFTLNLDPTSRVKAGQTALFPKRTFSKLDIEITNTSDGRQPLNGGAAAVGFAEIDIKDEHATKSIRERDVERMPLDLLSAEGKASLSHQLVLLMDRERVVPVPPRTDPEPNIAREFTLPTARTFSLTGVARLTSNAKGAVIDSALGLPSEADGGVNAKAREFLAGCVLCRSDSAIDGDPTTAWATPFVGVRRQFVNYQVAKPITFDHMDLQIVADRVHSRPTLLELTVDGQIRWITIPPLAVQAKQNSVDSVSVHFAPVTGRNINVKIASIDQVRLASKFSKKDALAPAAIAELGIPGLRLPALSAQLPGTCRSDLLQIDGKPIPVRISGATSDAEQLKPLTISTCDPTDPSARPTVQLAPGSHELETQAGTLSALELDRLVLDSAAGGAAGTTSGGKVTGMGAPLSGPKLTIAHQGRTKITVNVSGATAPFWFVLGESNNAGWQATVKGVGSLGGSQLVDGFANGWRIDPKGKQSLVVTVEWLPQRKVFAAIALSLVGGVLCCGLIALGFWRTRRHAFVVEHGPEYGDDQVPMFTLPWLPAGAPVALRTQIVATLAGAIVAATVAGIGAGALVAIALVVVFRVPRARALLALAPAALLALIGLYVANKQYQNALPPIFEWPTLFPRATAPAWAAIVLFGADAFYEMVRRGRSKRAEPTTE